jgi:hypothetical protein
MALNVRELAMLNPAIDNKLRAGDLTAVAGPGCPSRKPNGVDSDNYAAEETAASAI